MTDGLYACVGVALVSGALVAILMAFGSTYTLNLSQIPAMEGNIKLFTASYSNQSNGTSTVYGADYVIGISNQKGYNICYLLHADNSTSNNVLSASCTNSSIVTYNLKNQRTGEYNLTTGRYSLVLDILSPKKVYLFSMDQSLYIRPPGV
ncbi:MAG: hypothetical protein KGH60_03165 [Candidatus Micrarchaeota archaeon]|nr:hypothetical protein [Candidatus Micrarchaeota archaeon]